MKSLKPTVIHVPVVAVRPASTLVYVVTYVYYYLPLIYTKKNVKHP